MDIKKLNMSQLRERFLALEQENQYLRNIINDLPGLIYWKDTLGRYLGGNSVGVKFLNDSKISDYTEVNSFIGLTDFDIFDKETATQYTEHDRVVMTKKKPLVIEETVNLPNGDIVIQLSTKRPLYDIKGNVVGVMGNSIDITDRKEVELLRIKHQEQQAELRAHAEVKNCLDSILHSIHLYQRRTIKQPLDNKANFSLLSANISLSKRERQVLYFLSLNKSPKEIATILGNLEKKDLSPRTIQAIIDKQLFAKFIVHNVGQLIEKATILNKIPFTFD